MVKYLKQSLPLVLLLVGVWAYWPPIVSVVQNWASNPDYTHGFLVPLLCMAILYVRRDSLPPRASKVSLAAISLFVLAAVVRYMAGRFYIVELDAWSLPLWIGACVWLLLGWSVFRWAAPAIAFLWFAMPLPATVEIALSTPLQRLAATSSAWTLNLLSQPAVVDGTVILLGEQQLDVERACSGLRMFFGMFALAYATITIARPGLWKSIVIALAVFPVSILSNIARITVTALLATFWSGELAQLFSHDFAAVAMIPLAALLFGGSLWLLNSGGRRFSENRAAGMSWLLRYGVGATVVLVAVLFLQRHFSAKTLLSLKETAQRFEEQEDFRKAVDYLSRYLAAVPTDRDAVVHLADIHRRLGGMLRAIQLYQYAWELDPGQFEVGISALRLAVGAREYRSALQVCDQMSTKHSGATPKQLADVARMRAAVLVEYLRWDGGRADVTWPQAIDALRGVVETGDYSVWHAATLATAVMEHPPNDDSTGDFVDPMPIACRTIQSLVDDQQGNALAWLARFEFEQQYGSCGDSTPLDSLRRALALCESGSDPSSSRVFYAAAGEAQNREDWEAAEAYLRRAIEVEPRYYLPHLALANVYLEQRREDSDQRAIRTLRKGLESVGHTELSLLVPLASLLARSKQFEEARTLIAPLEQIEPNVSADERAAVSGSIALVRARIALEQQTARNAVELLLPLLQSPDIQRVQTRFPKVYAEMWTLYADLCIRLGEFDVATHAYQQAIHLTPRFDALKLQLASVATRAGQLSVAEQQLLGLVDGKRGAAEAFLALANVEIQRQKRLPLRRRSWSAAAKALQNAASNGAARSSLELITAEMLLAQGKSAEATELVKSALEEHDSVAQLWRAFAILQIETGNGVAAMDAVSKFRERSDSPVDAAILEAQVLARTEQFPNAIKLLESKLQDDVFAGDERIYIELSRLHLRGGEAESAVSMLEAGHKKMPLNHEIADEAARLAWLQQDWPRLATYVDWLREIEGEQGTEWRAYEAQILLSRLATEADPSFRSAIDLIRFVQQHRPEWPKGQFLFGELALIQGELDAALAAYQRAWRLGSRNILLADRIIDVLTRTNRFGEAQEYVTQASELLAISPQLFDRAAPYYVRGAEREQALALAKSWVKAQPDDADAHVRLGRVLLILAERESEESKDSILKEAESAFLAAVQKAPSDIRTWTASVLFYDRILNSREKAIATLQQFAAEVSISGLQKSFVLAQLYETLAILGEARKHYADAIQLADSSDEANLQAEVLIRAAQFYGSQSPVLAESLARRVLVLRPGNFTAKLILANLLLTKNEPAATKEVGILLQTEFAELEHDSRLTLIRTRIQYLSALGEPVHLNQAIELAEGILEKTSDDQRTLAQLYERVDRIAAAFSILEDLTNQVSPRPGDITAFLRFWQQHFVKNEAGDGNEIPFQNNAKRAYAELAGSPELLGEYFRWKLRERHLLRTGPLAAADFRELLADVQSSKGFESLDSSAGLQKLQARLTAVLVGENEPQLAVNLSEQGISGLPAELAEQSFVEALIAVHGLASAKSEPIVTRLTSITQRANDTLLQLLGDLNFLWANYDTAAGIYRKVLSEHPQSTLAQNNLALALAEIPGGLDEARSTLLNAIQQQPGNPQLLDSLASVELIRGDATSAETHLQQLCPNAAASVWLHLAEAHRMNKDANSAEQAFQRALALGVERNFLSARDMATLSTFLQGNDKSHAAIPRRPSGNHS